MPCVATMRGRSEPLCGSARASHAALAAPVSTGEAVIVAASFSASKTCPTRLVSECIAAISPAFRWKSPVVGRWKRSERKEVTL